MHNNGTICAKCVYVNVQMRVYHAIYTHFTVSGITQKCFCVVASVCYSLTQSREKYFVARAFIYVT